MANFSLVVNSKFQPFSFERYIQPYQIYGQAYREVEDALGELDTKASIWEEMANQQTDPYAYKMYKNYANDLENQAGQLAREGLNATSRRSMLNMRARYSKEITPIEQAYTARQKQAEQQQQALLQDPTLLLSRRAATTSLDDYIRNPQLAYESYSGKMLTAQAAQAASALAKEMRNNPRKWRSILNNSYYETLMQKGFSSGAVLQAIQDNPNAAKELTSIINDVYGSSKIDTWGDDITRQQAIDYIKQGLWSAVGETQYQTLDNWRAKMAEQEAMQKRAERRAAAKQKQEVETGNYRVNPLPLRGKQEIDNANKELQSYLKQGLLMRTARGLTLTEKGLRTLRQDNKGKTMPVENFGYDALVNQPNTEKQYVNKKFSTWYNKNIGGFNAKTGKVMTPTTKLNAYEQTIKEGSYDTYHSTEYDRQISNDYGKEYTKQIWSATATKDGEKYVEGVDFGGKKGFVTTKKYTKEDLKDYEVANIRYSKYGNTAILQSTKEGKNDVIRIKLPAGIHLAGESNVRKAIANADYWGDILHKGKQPILDKKGKVTRDVYGNVMYSSTPLTDYDKIVLQNRQNEALQDIYSYGSQIVVPSQTSDEQIKPWY